MNPALWHYVARVLAPHAHRTARARLDARKARLLEYGGQRAHDELKRLESALYLIEARLPAIIHERLESILDGSETQADVDELVRGLLADFLTHD